MKKSTRRATMMAKRIQVHIRNLSPSREAATIGARAQIA
jgi:hypothetical protein